MRGVNGRMRCGRLLAALLVLLACAGCGAGGSLGSGGGTGGERTAVRSLLDGWAAAVRDRDRHRYLAAVDPRATGYRTEQARVFANLAHVPLSSWDYRLLRTGGFAPLPGDGHRVAVEAELRYRLAGYDTAPVAAAVRLTAVRRDGHWYLAGQDAGQGARQLWDQGPVTVVRGDHSLVLGVGQDDTRLRALAGMADRAVPRVADAWKARDWPGRVVVELPASLERMGQLLGAPAANYRGIAAVTSGEVGNSGAAPADRIVVNPEAYGSLSDFGRQIVLTHETAHVATRERTSAATPLWLSEGFADWAAYRGTGRTAAEVAPELGRSVRSGAVPQQLPADGDFRFTGDSGTLARAYEGGWLACRMIAERWGEAALVAFYRARGSAAAVRSVLGVSEDEFTARWRGYVRAAFRGAF
ncbi:hypothetical protein [Streptomyces orinoci]|uniref:Lipoprotein n=1 Tax=Streptomyces orinoci TaxID=67339 RepID=A0ABV3JX26_STRON|nr:hypothetical protein [Streptomyces orinoci]